MIGEYNTQRPHSSLGYRTPAEVGAEARATPTRESGEVIGCVPGATVEADLERREAEVHPITPEDLS